MPTPIYGWPTFALGGSNNPPADMLSLETAIENTVAARTSSDNIIIGGTTYARSGSWASQVIPTGGHVVSSGSVYGWDVTKTAPFSAPAGWTFDVYVVATNGYCAVSVGSVTGATIVVRLLSVVSAGPTVTLGWRLVKR